MVGEYNDGYGRRLSNANISWANEYLSDFPAEMMERRKGEYCVTMHPGLLDMFVDAVREEIVFQKEKYKSEAQSKINDEVTRFFEKQLSDIMYYSLSENQIVDLSEEIDKSSSNTEKIEIVKHFVPQEGAALYEIMHTNPIENELKIIGVSPSEIIPKFKSSDNGVELVWEHVSVRADWQKYAKACLEVVEAYSMGKETKALKKEPYADRLNAVEDVADKIQNALDSGELDKEERNAASQER